MARRGPARPSAVFGEATRFLSRLQRLQPHIRLCLTGWEATEATLRDTGLSVPADDARLDAVRRHRHAPSQASHPFK